MSLITPLSRLGFVFAVLVTLGACDSGDPIDEPHPRDVAGEYQFTEFVFQPVGSGVQPIVVLDTLDQSQTSLRLSSGGNFILSYQFIGGDVYFPSGEFTVTAQSIRLNGNNSDREDFEKLLLSDEITLRRDEEDPDVLTAEIAKTIDPSKFSSRYEGVPQISGTLRLRLVKE